MEFYEWKSLSYTYRVVFDTYRVALKPIDTWLLSHQKKERGYLTGS